MARMTPAERYTRLCNVVDAADANVVLEFSGSIWFANGGGK